MAKFKKYEIGESVPIQINIYDVIPKAHIVRELEQIVSDLDTSKIEANYSELGQNAIHPKLLLCIIFYGYMTGIRSGRKLSQACKNNIDFIYLSSA